MRNQTSFRLTTTLLPTDTTAKTTQVINKLDSSGNKFYPSFTEETVVITNDDRTIMETTRATCNNWVLTFVKRGLSDDSSETQVDNRKLTWNPWSLCFITAWAGDWIDKDDDIVWTGKQTYTGDMESQWNATYRWLLTTEKWVKYPSFANVEALNAYANPFGWMFATVDSTGELYRYNDVTEEWSVVTTATPTNPEMADDETIWTVRIATDAEFEAWTDTWASGEYLVPTPSQILSMSKAEIFEITGAGDLVWGQKIVDCYLWGWCPILKLKTLEDDTYIIYNYYYLSIATDYNGTLQFICPTLWVNRWSNYIYNPRFIIKYSWTTVSQVTKDDGAWHIAVTSIDIPS